MTDKQKPTTIKKNISAIVNFFENKGYVLRNHPFWFLDDENLVMVKMHHADFKKYTVTIDCAIIEKCGELHDECDASVLDKCEAVRVDINGPIVSGIREDGAQCIRLVKDTNEFENIPLTMENLEKAIYAQFNPTLSTMGIITKHINALEACKKNFFPLLKKFDFVEIYNSLVGCTNDERKTSDHVTAFVHPNDNWHSVAFTISYMKCDENKLSWTTSQSRRKNSRRSSRPRFSIMKSLMTWTSCSLISSLMTRGRPSRPTPPRNASQVCP